MAENKPFSTHFFSLFCNLFFGMTKKLQILIYRFQFFFSQMAILLDITFQTPIILNCPGLILFSSLYLYRCNVCFLTHRAICNFHMCFVENLHWCSSILHFQALYKIPGYNYYMLFYYLNASHIVFLMFTHSLAGCSLNCQADLWGWSATTAAAASGSRFISALQLRQ